METPVAGTRLAGEARHQIVIAPAARHRAEHHFLARFVLDRERSAAPRTPRRCNNRARAPRRYRTSPGRGHSRRPTAASRSAPVRSARRRRWRWCRPGWRSGCRWASSSLASGATKASMRCAWSSVKPRALGEIAGFVLAARAQQRRQRRPRPAGPACRWRAARCRAARGLPARCRPASSTPSSSLRLLSLTM